MASKLTFTEEDVLASLDLSGAIQHCEDNGIDYDDLINVDQIKTRLLTKIHGKISIEDRTEVSYEYSVFNQTWNH
jgi:hypothetical protein